jgi:hypothetical protein
MVISLQAQTFPFNCKNREPFQKLFIDGIMDSGWEEERRMRSKRFLCVDSTSYVSVKGEHVSGGNIPSIAVRTRNPPGLSHEDQKS